ncbi:uncharacterized protein LOC114711177 [Neltuma alba]|uniref:uncharacterized protein LOC114711166 n=1 Tax=Neltuma alba TaxID=207710 RepID=UPI0010A34A74|nr:uncharacterized protein LOC114711166 [Prosopis alba]XP_028751365.1 uncharacterized protein LOC114711177 [Prosopis alba]
MNTPICSLSFCNKTTLKHREMGGCFSCRSSSTFNTVRVVHQNGFVEYFEGPISVGQVTSGFGNPSKHFVCTALQLLSPSSKPLNKDTLLQPGQVYFMLPFSILQSDASSPVDMASLAKRLTKKAKVKPCKDSDSSIGWSSPSRSPGKVGVADQIVVSYGGGRGPCRVRPWKPILDTIREISFNRRESDLQENN